MPEPATEPAATSYDGFAAEYSARNETSLFNAYYGRPEIIRLAGDVAGLEVLDGGCGSGPLMEALRAKEAMVSGFDLSTAMVELARTRLGADAHSTITATRPDPARRGQLERPRRAAAG